MLNAVTVELEAELRNTLPEVAFPDISPRYLTEPRNIFLGTPGLLVAPETTDQVSYVIKKANSNWVGIIPFGGGTGLVGGQLLDSNSEKSQWDTMSHEHT